MYNSVYFTFTFTSLKLSTCNDCSDTLVLIFGMPGFKNGPIHVSMSL